MFLAHFGVALAAKKAAPKVSLGTLFLSVNLVDLFWPIFLLLGVERVRIVPGITVVTPLEFTDYPITHSLLTNIAWALIAALLYGAIKKDVRGMIVVGTAVFSHWILDAVTHIPDLPLIPEGTTRVGLGLWNSLTGTILAEVSLLLFGLILYLRTTDSANRTGHIALWSWAAFVLVIYAANVFGPPPPSETAIGYAGLGLWLFVFWGHWIERNRQLHEPVSTSVGSVPP